MFDPPRGSHWFVSERGSLSGPFDTSRVEDLLRWGRISAQAHVCDDAGSAWIPIRRSMFARLFSEPPPAPAPMNSSRAGLFPLTLTLGALVAAVLQSIAT
jgi:hypothetical protein